MSQVNGQQPDRSAAILAEIKEVRGLALSGMSEAMTARCINLRLELEAAVAEVNSLRGHLQEAGQKIKGLEDQLKGAEVTKETLNGSGGHKERLKGSSALAGLPDAPSG